MRLYSSREMAERFMGPPWFPLTPKQFRGLATRSAKRAASHRAEIILACIVLHLR